MYPADQHPKKVQGFQSFISNSIKRSENQLIEKRRDFKINTPNNILFPHI